jgi:hypothetical protein
VSATWVGYKSDPVRRRNVTLEDNSRLTLDFTMQNAPVEWSQLTKYQAGTLLPQVNGNGKDVLIQQCFNCHAFGKIGAVGRHDLNGWKDEIDGPADRRRADQARGHQRGVALSRRRLRSRLDNTRIAGRAAGLQGREGRPQLLWR